MKNISIWKDTVKLKAFPKLVENKEVDVLIIGGGITGISTLYHLKGSGLKVMLVEQNKIGMSVTANSTGKLSYLQNDLIIKICKTLGVNIASKYLKSQIDAINLILDIIKKENIKCDLEEVDSSLYTNKKSEIKQIKILEHFLIKNGIKVSKNNSAFVKSEYMIKVNGTYMFHPLKFICGLIENRDFSIYEDTSIKEIKKVNSHYECFTDTCKIKAKCVVLASHYPYFIIPYMFPIKCSLEKSYLSASKCNTKPLSLISYSNPFVSIRTYKDYLIYLSNTHSINTNICDKDSFNGLMKKLDDLKLRPDYLWSNIDVITNDGLPYIGKIKDNLLIGTGYNTWGLTNGVLAGKILSDMVLNNNNKYARIFDPKRSSARKVIGALVDAGKTISGYFNGFMYKNNKKVHFCPHIGCKLIFNDVEKTWDCPCHGSRFDETGKCISGPSNKDIDI